MTGKNWKIHWIWPICLKYITAPAVGLVFSFAYPKFRKNFEKDPPYIYSFAMMHVVMIAIVGMFLFPRFFNVIIPAERVSRGDGKYDVAPQVTIGESAVIHPTTGLEGGNAESSSLEGSNKAAAVEEPVTTQEKHRV